MTRLSLNTRAFEKRSHVRVDFTRTISLVAGEGLQERYPARNLSLSGLYLEGVIDASLGECCRLEVHDTGPVSSQFYDFSGKISRRDETGIGVEFTAMGGESLKFLQTVVLYSADDPFEAACQFHEEFVPRSPPNC